MQYPTFHILTVSLLFFVAFSGLLFKNMYYAVKKPPLLVKLQEDAALYGAVCLDGSPAGNTYSNSPCSSKSIHWSV